MDAEPEVLEVTLLDATYDGPKEIKVATSDGTYTLFIVPRRNFDDYRSHTKMNQAGIYMMAASLTQTGAPVYIGQARKRKNGNGAIYRVIEHINRGEHLFCQWAILLVDDPKKFGATELNTLENVFTNLAVKSGRMDVRNGCEPSANEIQRATKVRLNRIVKATRLMLATLGVVILEPAPLAEDDDSPAPVAVQESEDEAAILQDTTPASSEPILELHMMLRGIAQPARLNKQGESYTLLAGSPVKAEATSKTVAKLRERYQGKIVDGHTTVDLLFGSPSTAASYVSGNQRNGLRTWKTVDGHYLGDLRES